MGLNGCKKEVDIPDYKIDEESLKRLLAGDPHQEMSTIFGGIRCPICGSCYAFKPSRLKSMIVHE